MRIVTNETYIERRQKAGEILTLGGMGTLIATLVIYTIKPEWALFTLLLMVIGFFGSLVGSYFVQRFAGPRAHHEVMPKALKGFGDDYVLFMYTLPVPFALLEPGGVTVFLVKAQGGTVSYEDGKWQHQQKLKILRQFAGEEALGRPERQLQPLVEDMEAYLNEHLPEEVDVPVRGIVVFIDPEVQVEVDDAPITALRDAELKSWLRNAGRRSRLPAEIRQTVAEVLGVAES
jgi:hypothetical protein